MEPFSILLGAVSILTAIISTFGGHIENIHNRSIHYRRCKENLGEYKRRLEDLADQLQKWEIIWYRQHYDIVLDDRATYDFLWGEAGYDRIVEIVRAVTTGFNDIIAMFRFQHRSNARFDWDEEDLPEELRGKPGPQIQRWNEFLDSTYTPATPGFYEKFAFAIYKNAAFKIRIEKLETDVKDLESTSTRYFYQRHDIDSLNSPTREEVQRMKDIYVEQNEFLRFFQRIYCLHVQQQNDGNGFFLQLVFAQRPAGSLRMQIPTEDCRLHEETIERAVNALRIRANLVCTMYTETWDWSREDPLTNASMFDITYPAECPSTFDQLAAQMTKWNQHNNIALDIRSRCTFTGENTSWRQVRDMLILGQNPQDTDPRDVFRQILNHYRLILAAAGVSRAVIFFYGTSWLRNLCSCRILRARPVQSPLRELITRYSTEDDFDEGQEPSSICQHIPEYGRYLTFVNLAVFLAEMAIVAPIKIEHLQEAGRADIFNGDVRFWLPQQLQLPDGVRNPLTASELVLHLEQLKPIGRALHVGLKYKKAVEECLATRQRFLSRGAGVLTAGDLDRCIKDIVKPLEVHCAILEQEYKKLAAQRYFQDAVRQENL